MRRALDSNPPITTYHGQAGYGYFGKHAGYDYGVVKWAVRAPETGVITAVYANRPTADGGNIVEMRGAYTHRFLHLDTINVSVGQQVTEGQQLAITGNTGNVGYHLHHDVRKNGTAWTDSYANYYDWEQLIKGGTMGLDLGQARVMAHGILGRNGFDGRPNALAGECDADLNKNHVGKDAYAKIWEMYNSQESINFRNSTNGAYAERDRLRVDLNVMTQDRNGLIAKLDTANKTIADQSVTIGELQQQVTDLTSANATLTAENEELNKKLATIGDTATNLSGLQLIKLGLLKIWGSIK